MPNCEKCGGFESPMDMAVGRHTCPSDSSASDAPPQQVLRQYDSGRPNFRVTLERWRVGGYVVKVADGIGNFTTFDVHDEVEGDMKARFVADLAKRTRKHERTF